MCAYKLSGKTITKYISSVFSINNINEELKNTLYRISKLSSRINVLNETVEPFKDYRNGKLAHLDNVKLDSKPCYLIKIFEALAAIDYSLSIIEHCLLNPRNIDTLSLHPEDEVINRFKRKVKDDPVLKESKEVIFVDFGIHV